MIALGRALALVAFAALAGCHDRLCHDIGINPNGGRYRASIVEPYDSASTFTYDRAITASNGAARGSCAGIDGIQMGTILEFKAAGTVENRTGICQLIQADLLSPPLQTEADPTSARADADAIREQVAEISLMYVAKGVTVGGCTGGLGIDIRYGVYGGDIFAPATPGKLPPALLYRLFVSSGGSCQGCEDNFVVQMTKE